MIEGTYYESDNNRFNNILFSVLNRLVEIDNYLKDAREDLFKNEKLINQYDTKRDVEIEKVYLNEIKHIEKFAYDEFKRIINTFKSTEDTFKYENNKLLREANNLKLEKSNIQNTIKELNNKLETISYKLGSFNNEY